MVFFMSILTLLAPIWVPMSVVGLYAFIVRKRLPVAYLSISDKLYWCLYFGLWLIASVGFCLEIFSWQMAFLSRVLWLLALGLPMLIAMAGVLYVSLMATDSW